MMHKIRNRLIQLIAGNKPVVMNVTITNRGIVIPNENAFIAKNLIKNG